MKTITPAALSHLTRPLVAAPLLLALGALCLFTLSSTVSAGKPVPTLTGVTISAGTVSILEQCLVEADLTWDDVHGPGRVSVTLLNAGVADPNGSAAGFTANAGGASLVVGAVGSTFDEIQVTVTKRNGAEVLVESWDISIIDCA